MKKLKILAALLLAASASTARAEIPEITIAQQFGVSFLPFMLMERDHLVEKHAKAAGVEVKTNWQKVAGPSVINDGLLSGTVHFGAVGAPSLITLWSKTKGNVGIKGMAAMTSYPLYFVTRNPDLKSLKDLSGKDKIAVPSVKISTQAIMLQMAAADLFGQANYQKFDEYTVSLAHPDAMVALMNNTGGVNAHFATSPFYEQEMKIPGARVLTTSYDILGGRASALVVITTTKFHDGNPKLYKAFLAAQKEAIDTINADKRKAAQAYLDIANDKKNTVDDIFAVINDKDYAYTLSPEKVFKTAVFMAKVGSIKDAPATWQDMFFPDIHNIPGD
ncbi:MAG: sulfonate transport system substrate-binding protein [Hyphomicrobiales bacterium]|nr:sulfonate transport system substrate-binding protein [Hyphomicrobiales bacterium]